MRAEVTKKQIIDYTCGALRKHLEKSNLPEKGFHSEMTNKALDAMRAFEHHVRKQTNDH